MKKLLIVALCASMASFVMLGANQEETVQVCQESCACNPCDCTKAECSAAKACTNDCTKKECCPSNCADQKSSASCCK